jgi:hypothetical protein
MAAIVRVGMWAESKGRQVCLRILADGAGTATCRVDCAMTGELGRRAKSISKKELRVESYLHAVDRMVRRGSRLAEPRVGY